MILDYKILGTTAGGNSVFNSSFRNRTILKVKLEGTGFDIVLGIIPSPGSRQVQFISSFGVLRFGINFPPNAKVYVLYKV